MIYYYMRIFWGLKKFKGRKQRRGNITELEEEGAHPVVIAEAKGEEVGYYNEEAEPIVMEQDPAGTYDPESYGDAPKRGLFAGFFDFLEFIGDEIFGFQHKDPESTLA